MIASRNIVFLSLALAFAVLTAPALARPALDESSARTLNISTRSSGGARIGEDPSSENSMHRSARVKEIARRAAGADAAKILHKKIARLSRLLELRSFLLSNF